MDKMLKSIKHFLPTKRRIIQLYAALLYNAHVKGFVEGNIHTGGSKMLCVPGLNCYSCPGAIGACPLGALQNAIASAGHRAPTYVLGILLLYGLIFGRTICGFLCPFGLIQELLHKLPTLKVNKSRWTRRLSWLKYVLLVVFVLLIPLYYAAQTIPLPAFCKFICPAGTLEGAVGLLSHPNNADKFNMLGPLFTGKFLILLGIVALCVFMYRAFCRFLCPLGAIYGLFSRVAVIGVKVDTAKCVNCGRCTRGCKMDIRRVGDHECIQCGECIDMCPTSAISFKAGKYTIAQKFANGKQHRRLTGFLFAIALMSLAVVLIFANIPASAPATSEPSPTAIPQTQDTTSDLPPVGKEVGMLAPNFEAPVYGQDATFILEQQRGKAVVINFWATWCTPCINELPYFDEVSRTYGDDVCVVALHSNLVTDDVVGFLTKHDYQLTFALDQTGDIIKAYGGSTMLPHTIILDRNGVIVYNAIGSLTFEKLESLLDPILLK